MRLLYVALALAFALATSSSARAQATTIGFDNDCDGQPLGLEAGEARVVSGSLYASCGVLSISSAGLLGKQQLARPDATEVFGISGDVVLAGAYTVDGMLNFGDLVIVFSPAIKDVAFHVLDLDNATGLEVIIRGPGDVEVATERPVAENGRVRFAYRATTPIRSVTLKYEPQLIPVALDDWYVDALSFAHTDGCGDGVLDEAAGEECDDRNSARCDGCDDKCKKGPVGCLDGTRCIEPEVVDGCTFCALSRAPEPNGEILASPRPTTTLCGEKLFCQVGHCDGEGKCAITETSCDDGLACTDDSCDEDARACRHETDDDACLIDGECYERGDEERDNSCRFCDPKRSQSAWSTRAEGYQCADPSCASGRETPAGKCSARGRCQQPEPKRCESARCEDERSCDGGCRDDSGCAHREYCELESGRCRPDFAPGDACSRASECPSDSCVGGLCCDRACDGSCEACNLAGSLGKCTPFEAGLDPLNACGPWGVCDGQGACVSYEARGNGLCASSPGKAGGNRGKGATAMLTIVALGLALVRRRAQKRRGQRDRA